MTPADKTFLYVAGGIAAALGLYWLYEKSTEVQAPIQKGLNCSVLLTDGRRLRLPGGMIHDESGRSYPRLAVLFAPLRKTNESMRAGSDYFGGSYAAKKGLLEAPPRDLSSWRYVGDVDVIYYSRTGNSHAHDYKHDFKRPVKLYQRGSIYRIQLPPGAVYNWRGFVDP